MLIKLAGHSSASARARPRHVDDEFGAAAEQNVAAHLGIAAANGIRTGRPVTRAEADQVNVWLDDCEASRLVAHDEALTLEDAFKREWLPPLTKR